jgi:hypothetical protein
MEIKEIRTLARRAYLSVLQEHQVGWCSPPTEMRDRNWSRFLRETWPDCATVYLEQKGSVNLTALQNWCKDKECGYWSNANGTAWYFERRAIAVLFKLTFGGSQND